MGGKASQREVLARIPWPDRRERLKEEAEAVRSLTPTERLHRIAALRRLCLELAASAGNLEAVQRYYDWREAQWRERIREVIRLYEHRQTARP
jgi:hypothetical protein